MRRMITFLKSAALLFAITMLVTPSANAGDYANGAPAGGSGTIADPFLIADAADLVKFGAYANNDASYYELTSDIDMTAVTYNSSANTFKGFLDGKNKKILNLTVTRASSFDGMAFIAKMGAGEVKNLGLKNVSVVAPANCRHNGGLIGQTLGTISILNCFVTGTVTGVDGDCELGALVGQASTWSVLTISDCFADVSVSPGRDVGGLIGQMAAWGNPSTATITNCVSYGTAISSNSARSHALVGNYVGLPGTATFSNSYYGEGSTSDETAAGTAKILNADLGSQASYAGFDFAGTWELNNGRAELSQFILAEVLSNITYVNMTGVDNSNNPAIFSNAGSVTLQKPLGNKSGFAWYGWFADAALSNPVSVPAIPLGTTVDQTFYGKWVAETTSNIVYVNMDGVDNSNNPASYTDAAEVTLSAPAGTKAGFWWDGWYTDAGFANPITTPAIAQGTTGTKTFYGKWTAKPSFSGGTGTVSDPFLVSNKQDLHDLLGYDGGTYFKLTANIDMTGETWVPLYSRGSSVEFQSVIDGNNMEISNLTITGTANSVGFINLLGIGGVVKKLGFINLTVNGGTYSPVGGIVGTMWNNDGDILNCYIKGNSSISGGSVVGGLLGFGWTIGNSIKNNFVDATITGTAQVGGLIGRCHLGASANFSNNAFYGTVNGPGGAIIGANQANAGTLQNSLYYATGITSSVNQSPAVEVADLTVQGNFPLLDFNGAWLMGASYPELRASYAITYMFTYVVDNSNNPSQYYSGVASTLNEPIGTSSYAGLGFMGWYSDAALTNLVSQPEIPVSATGDVVFYAKWSENHPTAVQDQKRVEIGMYPNPATSIINITGAVVSEVTVYSTNGRLLKTERNTQTVDVSDLKAGVYVVKISTRVGETLSKLIVE